MNIGTIGDRCQMGTQAGLCDFHQVFMKVCGPKDTPNSNSHMVWADEEMSWRNDCLQEIANT